MRRCLAILFLLIFTCQVLPLKVWGKLLNQGQDTEEVQDDAEDAPEGKVTKFGDDQVITNHCFDLFASECGFNNKVTAFIHREETLPSVHIAEMLSPPPDSK